MDSIGDNLAAEDAGFRRAFVGKNAAENAGDPMKILAARDVTVNPPPEYPPPQQPVVVESTKQSSLLPVIGAVLLAGGLGLGYMIADKDRPAGNDTDTDTVVVLDVPN